MLWNDELLFLHYPKTAGKTITTVFVNHWKGPVHGILSKGLVRALHESGEGAPQLVEGRGHENMRRADTVLRNHGSSVENMECIISCIRNPYDLMVSNYFFLRTHYENNRNTESFQMAMKLGFDDFCEQLQIPPPRKFYALKDGSIPKQLRFIRFEYLEQDLLDLGAELNFSVDKIPHLNPSKHQHFSTYLTSRSERAIYDRFEFFFEVGGYARQHSVGDAIA